MGEVALIRILKNYAHYLGALLSNLYFGFPARNLTVIGVTGTDGKTTTTHLLYEILTAAGKKVAMISSVYAMIGNKEYDTGFHVTSPNYWQLQKLLAKAKDNGQHYVVLEVTSHAISQHRVFGIPFAIAVLTNVTHEHLDYHKSYEEYLATKLKLLRMADVAVVNVDDESFKSISKIKSKLITYGIKKGNINFNSYPFTTKLPGEYNKLNCLAAAAAAKELGIDDAVIRETLATFGGVTGRFEEVPTNRDFRVIIDFAHTPNAFKQVLLTVRKQTKGRLIHVFGAAGLRDYTKRPLMGAISARFADIIVLTEEDYRTEDVGEIMRQIEKGIMKNAKFPTSSLKDSGLRGASKIPNRQEAINRAIQLAKKGDIVILTGKGHEKSLCRGKTEYPWSEHDAVKLALANLK